MKSRVIHATSEYARSRNGSVVSSRTRIALLMQAALNAYLNFAVEGLPSELCEQKLKVKMDSTSVNRRLEDMCQERLIQLRKAYYIPYVK